jgi:hypothetical protein
MEAIENYNNLYEILSDKYQQVNGLEFYRYIFPDNENQGEMNTDFSKPNGIYLYTDERDQNTKRRLRRRIMLNDTWKQDYKKYVKDNPMTLCSGLSYRGRANRLTNAQKCHAMVFDLDAVGENELQNLFLRIGRAPAYRTLPQPTFIVMSGTGLHIYYVFDEAIDLYPNIKLQLKALKYDLTFRIWDYKGTSQQKEIQYQSINQGFRMVGSSNDKYEENLEVIAFRTGDKVDIDYLNQYTIEDKNKVDLNQPFAPTKYTREEAKEKFPEWYQRVVIEGNREAAKWDISRDLYDWWLRQVDQVKGGHRYFFLMCMSIYAVKCNIPKSELREDMKEVFEEIASIEHTNPLTEEDINSALEAYDRGYYNFTIDDIVKLTDIPIQKNKRNYRTQEQHISVMNAIKKVLYPQDEWRNKEGRPSKEKLVKDYIKENPEDNPTQIARALEISRTTVYKYLNDDRCT